MSQEFHLLFSLCFLAESCQAGTPCTSHMGLPCYLCTGSAERQSAVLQSVFMVSMHSDSMHGIWFGTGAINLAYHRPNWRL